MELLEELSPSSELLEEPCNVETAEVAASASSVAQTAAVDCPPRVLESATLCKDLQVPKNKLASEQMELLVQNHLKLHFLLVDLPNWRMEL